ncbi:MAG TPA: hypothetical protein DEQ09_04160, partial [Bacteroidales bacterium]|nr:hypothetical protein [Bacteroidales bacterium]
MKHIITFLLSILFVHLSLYSQNDEIELLESLINDAEIVYNDNQDASEAALEYLFYEIEKARETRVFGTDSEIILAQTRLSKAIETFLNVVNIDSVIANAYSFILNSTAEDDIKLAFEAIVDNANDLVNEPDVSFDTIPYLAERIVEATNLVNSIVTAVNYSSQLAAVDTRLSDGLQISIDQAKTLIMNLAGSPDDFNMAAYKLDETIELIKQILTATSLIDNTEDFEEAKTALNDVIEANIIVLANTGSTGADIDVAIENMINAIIIFKETTQTGEVQIILKNPGFEDNVQNWTVSTDDQSGWGVYIDTVNGVDGSRDLSFWSGVDYTGIASQSLINLPNGMYEISLMAIVTADNCFTLFGQSDGNLVETQLLFEDWTYTKRKIQIEVTDGTLIFGFKGSADGNLIPANQWARIDNFEIKLLPDIIIDNPGFEQDMTGWTVITDDQSGWGVYIDATNGVGGSQDLSFWSGVDYTGIA